MINKVVHFFNHLDKVSYIDINGEKGVGVFSSVMWGYIFVLDNKVQKMCNAYEVIPYKDSKREIPWL